MLVQAQKYVPALDTNGYEQNLPSSEELTHSTEQKEAYDLIKGKFNKVQELYRALKNDNEVLPSQRMANFSGKLQSCEADLKLHRDTFWKAYLKSCLVIVAMIATGIIPGMVYSGITGKSPLFFSRSEGEKFVEDINRAKSANLGA